MKFKEKEKIFWKRQMSMRKKFNPFFRWFPLGYPLMLLLVMIGHYGFAAMTALHMAYKFLFQKKQVVSN